MNKLHLEVITEFEEISKIRCTRCNGIGLVKRNTMVKCSNCNEFPYSNKQCYVCENKNKSIWVECGKCFGNGEVDKKKIIEMKNKLEGNYIHGRSRASI